MNTSQLKIELYRWLEFLVGKEKVRKIYLKRCVHRYIAAGCIFIHIPKAGGTSVAVSTIGKRAGHFTAAEIIAVMGNKAYNELFSFSITRHPVDRIYSSYNFIISGGGEMGGVRKDRQFEAKSFRSFNAFVLEWLQFRELHSENILFKPQTDFVYHKAKPLVNYIGKIENMDEVIAVLSKRLNREIVIGQLNKTRGIASKDISAEAKKVLEDLYKKDFDLLNY